MKRINNILSLCLVLISLSACSSIGLSMSPKKLVFSGGDILTMSASRKNVEAVDEAVYVRDGIIRAVGSKDEVLRAAGNDVEMIDLEGATLMPGLIEAHTHPIATAMLGQTIDVSGFTHKSRAEVMATLRKEGKGKPFLKWTVAYGWDPVMVDDLESPTLAELDEISPEKPFVILTQMMHDAYANSKALSAAGIHPNTPNPKAGEFVRDADGKLTGAVREVSAINHLMSAIPLPPKGAVDLLTNLQYGKYAKAGFTTIGVLGPVGRVDNPIDMLQTLSEHESVQVRTVVYGLPKQFEKSDWKPGDGNNKFKVQGVKFWMDGSPFAGGAALEKPYENSKLVRERLHLEHNHVGALNYESGEFEKSFEKYHRLGFQIAVHVQGERAVERVLSVAEKVLGQYPRKDHRHRLEHNALISKPQLQRAKELGLTTSFFVDHIYYYGDQLDQLVGKDRTLRYMPLKTAIDAGHTITIHTDNPASPIDPLRAMRTALLRQSRKTGMVLGEEQKLSSEQALKAITINAAWQLGVDDKVGSIDVGKHADFVVLSHNPLESKPESLTAIQVKSTWIDGERVHTNTFSWQNIKLTLSILGNLI